MYQNTHHHMWWVRAKHRFRTHHRQGRMIIRHQFRTRDASLDRQPKIQSSSVEETLQRILGQTNDDCRFQNFTLTYSLTSATFACLKIRFKTEVCTCSQFLTEAMLWIKEVEMVDSVDELKSSSSIRGISMPNFEILDARIATALNKIIHNSHFKRKISLEEQKAQTEDRFLLRKTDRLLDLIVLPGHWSQRFRREICRPIYNCSSKWRYSGIRFKVGRNFIVYDENLTRWHLGRIVQMKNTRVWETKAVIGIVQYGDSSEESRQIEDDGEKKYRARFTK